MTDYLLKVTLIWALMLGLYELLYRKSTAFTLNRLYLFFALFAGVLLPLIPLPVPSGNASGLVEVNRNMQHLDRAVLPTAAPGTEAAGIDVGTLLIWLYCAGALITLVISLREVVLILRTAVYGQYTTISGYKIFSSNRPHAPFSFMGWVFIAGPSLYDEKGLQYIFRHEEAHNQHWHWFDMMLMQLFFIVFWFHPLIWRFRYLLKLNHEYEADHYASGNNAYEYGHFLLQQTLLKGTPIIAHSFHFSPIKNRIFMLTQKRKSASWKYVIVVPALLTCSLLFAKSEVTSQRVRVGDKTTYNGHEFLWQKEALDSILLEDPVTGKTLTRVARRAGAIYRMDGDSVYDNESEKIVPAQFRYKNEDLRGYILRNLNKATTIPDSVKMISLTNMVIDESGKLVYYDIDCITDANKYTLSDPASPLHSYGKLIEHIIAESPAWVPAAFNGREVKARISGLYTIYSK